MTIAVMDERFDGTVARGLKKEIQNIENPAGLKLFIDLTNTTFIDSPASGLLLSSWSFTKKNGRI